MIDSLVNRIKKDSVSVSSQEIAETVKVSFILPAAIGLSTGLAAGIGGTYYATRPDEEKLKEEKRKQENKALLYGLGGAVAGYGAGKAMSHAGRPLSYSPVTDNGNLGFNEQDMQYIMGRGR